MGNLIWEYFDLGGYLDFLEISTYLDFAGKFRSMTGHWVHVQRTFY